MKFLLNLALKKNGLQKSPYKVAIICVYETISKEQQHKIVAY